MTPKTLADRIESAIITANDRFASQIIGVQEQLYDDLVRILKDLELDPEGYIRQSADNRKILKEAQKSFDKIIDQSGYSNAIEDHLKAIPKIDSLNQQYFKSIAEGFSLNKNFIKSLQTQSIQTVNSYLLQDGLAAQVKIPLNEILNQNVNAGGQYSGMLKQLQTFINGNSGLDGRLLSYSRNFLKDSLFQYSRSFQQSVTADLKLEFYLYSGFLIDRSREFCIERAGKYYHQKEIEGWASLSWKGKSNLTTESSIFILAGGYACNHSIVPVHRSSVPREVIQRNIDNGNIPN